MRRKRFTAEQVIGTLQEAETELAEGRSVGRVGKKLGATGRTCYRWR